MKLLVMLSLLSFGLQAKVLENSFFSKKKEVKRASLGCKKIQKEKIKLKGANKFKESLFWCDSCKAGSKVLDEKVLKFVYDDGTKIEVSKNHLNCSNAGKRNAGKKVKNFYCDPKSKKIKNVKAVDDTTAKKAAKVELVFLKKKDASCSVVRDAHVKKIDILPAKTIPTIVPVENKVLIEAPKAQFLPAGSPLILKYKIKVKSVDVKDQALKYAIEGGSYITAKEVDFNSVKNAFIIEGFELTEHKEDLLPETLKPHIAKAQLLYTRVPQHVRYKSKTDSLNNLFFVYKVVSDGKGKVVAAPGGEGKTFYGEGFGRLKSAVKCSLSDGKAALNNYATLIDHLKVNGVIPAKHLNKLHNASCRALATKKCQELDFPLTSSQTEAFRVVPDGSKTSFYKAGCPR